MLSEGIVQLTDRRQVGSSSAVVVAVAEPPDHQVSLSSKLGLKTGLCAYLI